MMLKANGAREVLWQGRQLKELTREELEQAAVWAAGEIERLQRDCEALEPHLADCAEDDCDL